DGLAKSFPISVEKINNGKEYVVTAGLTAGDVIVAEGAALLREGTPIQPKQQTAAAAPAAEQEQAAAQTENTEE
ncbi:MAG: efflux RND transporter periplasmic adaptor subunit, partial [Alistipes sp.]|nr:efflux RND transporter periplasmic adaptor subunit [Alistipes sp.]